LRIPANKRIAFITDLWVHLASYIFGFLGGMVLCVWVLIRRSRLRVTNGYAAPNATSRSAPNNRPSSAA
jgi:hypothetical protein